MREIRVGEIGEIVQGDEVGRFVEVIDDAAHTGGFLIMTYADENRSPAVFDVWAESMIEVENQFEHNRWKVIWLDHRSEA